MGAFFHGLKLPANATNKAITDVIPLLAGGTGCLVYVPKTILFGFDPARELPLGPLDQSTIDTLEDMGATYKTWATLIASFSSYNVEFVKNNKELFAKYFPNKVMRTSAQTAEISTPACSMENEEKDS